MASEDSDICMDMLAAAHQLRRAIRRGLGSDRLAAGGGRLAARRRAFSPILVLVLPGGLA